MSQDSFYDADANIAHLILKVTERGWRQHSDDTDDFAVLRSDRRFRETQAIALYEYYFLPERHEFELAALDEIIRQITEMAPAAKGFAAGAIASGLIGGAAYDALKVMCTRTAAQFKKLLGNEGAERAKSFEQIAVDAEKIKMYFQKHEKARIEDIEKATGLARDCIYPLVKVAGCRHVQRGEGRCNWYHTKIAR
jgi:hypothetical protein